MIMSPSACIWMSVYYVDVNMSYIQFPVLAGSWINKCVARLHALNAHLRRVHNIRLSEYSVFACVALQPEVHTNDLDACCKTGIEIMSITELRYKSKLLYHNNPLLVTTQRRNRCSAHSSVYCEHALTLSLHIPYQYLHHSKIIAELFREAILFLEYLCT